MKKKLFEFFILISIVACSGQSTKPTNVISDSINIDAESNSNQTLSTNASNIPEWITVLPPDGDCYFFRGTSRHYSNETDWAQSYNNLLFAIQDKLSFELGVKVSDEFIPLNFHRTVGNLKLILADISDGKLDSANRKIRYLSLVNRFIEAENTQSKFHLLGCLKPSDYKILVTAAKNNDIPADNELIEDKQATEVIVDKTPPKNIGDNTEKNNPPLILPSKSYPGNISEESREYFKFHFEASSQNDIYKLLTKGKKMRLNYFLKGVAIPYEIIFPNDIHILKKEITKSEFELFIKATGYKTEAERENNCMSYKSDNKEANWENPGFAQTKDHPVVCVSWIDAVKYAEWKSNETVDGSWRLPSLPEFLAILSIENNQYPWQDNAWKENISMPCLIANVKDQSSELFEQSDQFNCVDDYPFTAPVNAKSLRAPQIFGLIANVREWTCSEGYHVNKIPGCPDIYVGVYRHLFGLSWRQNQSMQNFMENIALRQFISSDDTGFRLVFIPNK